MSDEITPDATPEGAQEEGQEPTDDTQVVPEDSPEGPEPPETSSTLAYEREQRQKANREAKNLRDRLRKFEEAEEARKREAMSQAEQLEADKAKAQTALAESQSENQSLRSELDALRIKTSATTRAIAVGTKAERLEAVLKLSDFSSALDDGQIDTKAIDAAIKATLKDFPEFRKGAANLGGPSNPDSDPPDTKKDFRTMPKEQFDDLAQRVSWGERVVPS